MYSTKAQFQFVQLKILKCVSFSINKRPRHLFNFKALSYDAYWRASVNRGRFLFKIRKDSNKLLRLRHVLFPDIY